MRTMRPTRGTPPRDDAAPDVVDAEGAGPRRRPALRSVHVRRVLQGRWLLRRRRVGGHVRDGGGACQDCTQDGPVVRSGGCASIDSGPAPVCDEMQCRNMLTLCIPVDESPAAARTGRADARCYSADGTCM